MQTTLTNAELACRDRKVVWHPCTPMKDHELLPRLPIRRGEGAWLEQLFRNPLAAAAARATRELYPWTGRRGLRAYRHALERGVLLRPLADVLYLMPPYVIGPAEVELPATALGECLDVACA